MIRARAVQFSHGRTPVLHGVDLDAADGEVLGVLGPNGSGKTTLLRTLHGGLRPAAGTVHVDDLDVASAPAREVARRVAVVVQEHGGEDLPLLVAGVVLLGRTPHAPLLGGPGPDGHRAAADALRRVGALHLADRRFAHLSGGEKQRVLLARALTQSARHLLLDEPTNHLDVRYQHEVLDLVRGLGTSTVVVLHDLNLAAAYCDRVVLLDAGRVVAAGSPRDVLVPDVLEPVYGLHVRRVDLGDGVHLAFRPRRRAEVAG